MRSNCQSAGKILQSGVGGSSQIDAVCKRRLHNCLPPMDMEARWSYRGFHMMFSKRSQTLCVIVCTFDRCLQSWERKPTFGYPAVWVSVYSWKLSRSLQYSAYWSNTAELSLRRLSRITKVFYWPVFVRFVSTWKPFCCHIVPFHTL